MWKLLTGVPLTRQDLRFMDMDLLIQLETLESMAESDLDQLEYPASIMRANDKTVLHLLDQPCVTASTRHDYISAVLQVRLHEFDQQVAAMREGMAEVVPVPLLSLLHGTELEALVAGNVRIDLHMLKAVTEYRPLTLPPSHELFQWFWEILDSFSEHQRGLFLRFVWGRSRLPRFEASFSHKFVINVQVDKFGAAPNVSADSSLPTALTCFFMLKLPPYSSKDIMQDKLCYAVHSCKAMDADAYAHTDLHDAPPGNIAEDSDDEEAPDDD